MIEEHRRLPELVRLMISLLWLPSSVVRMLCGQLALFYRRMVVFSTRLGFVYI